MKRTSPSSRLVSIAARSPGRSIAGPEVMRMFTPISFAIIPDRVVLPKPGGRTAHGQAARRGNGGVDKYRKIFLDLCLADIFGKHRGRRGLSPSSSGRYDAVIILFLHIQLDRLFTHGLLPFSYDYPRFASIFNASRTKVSTGRLLSALQRRPRLPDVSREPKGADSSPAFRRPREY